MFTPAGCASALQARVQDASLDRGTLNDENGVMADLRMLEVQGRTPWRAWLEHTTRRVPLCASCSIRNTRMESVPYEDAVREALCFGWIDSLIKRIDEDRHAHKFTPRKPGSRWSEINR